MIMKILTLNKKNIIDFAKERNLLLKKSKESWNFFLDSDETISDELLSTLKNMDLESSPYKAYKVKRTNLFVKQKVGADCVVRLVNKNGTRWVRAVHEYPVVDGKIGRLKGLIIHNTADNLSYYLNKMNKYSTIHALENKKEGKTSSLLKIVFYPIAKFFVTLVTSRNIVFSIYQSFHSYLAWTKLYFGEY